MAKYEAGEAEDDIDALNELLAQITEFGGEVVSVFWRPANDGESQDGDEAVMHIRPAGYVVVYKTR